MKNLQCSVDLARVKPESASKFLPNDPNYAYYHIAYY